MQFSKPQHYTATVSSKVQLTPYVWAVDFALESPQKLVFTAGQTMVLHITEGINRAMSIASLPKERSHVLMVHDVSPMGPGSKWTLGLAVGDKVSFIAPLGAFALDKLSPRKKVFIATGTGVIPFRSMIFDYLENGGTGGITLYWGLRHKEDIYWKQEFETLCQIYPSFHFVLTLSKPTDHWQGRNGRPACRRGRVTDHVFTEEKNMNETDFYLCGNKDMVKEVSEKLLHVGVPKEQIKTELFF